MVAHFPFCSSFSTWGDTSQMPRVDSTLIVACLDTFPFRPIPCNGIIWWCHAFFNLSCLHFQSRFFAQLFTTKNSSKHDRVGWLWYCKTMTWPHILSEPAENLQMPYFGESSLLVWCAISTGRKLTTFRRRLIFPSSGSNH